MVALFSRITIGRERGEGLWPLMDVLPEPPPRNVTPAGTFSGMSPMSNMPDAGSRTILGATAPFKKARSALPFSIAVPDAGTSIPDATVVLVVLVLEEIGMVVVVVVAGGAVEAVVVVAGRVVVAAAGVVVVVVGTVVVGRAVVAVVVAGRGAVVAVVVFTTLVPRTLPMGL